MANLRIIHKNVFNLHNSIGMAVGGSAALFPLTNLKTETKTDTWRSTDLLSPEIEFTWATGQTVSGLALAFTNLIAGSTVRLRLYSAEVGGSLLYDQITTLVDSVEAPEGFTSINSLSFNYGGGVHFSTFFDAVPAVRRASVTLTSVANPDGFIEVGRIVIGDSFEPDDNANYGAKVGFEDTTKKIRRSSGNLAVNRGTVSRFLEFEMGDMSENDNFALLTIFRRVATSQPVFLSLIPKAQIDKSNLDLQIYGLVDEAFQHILEAYNIYSSRIKLVEI